MAASSSSSQLASSSRSCKYDVFLSFRGEDTRKTFVDHIYRALMDRKICTYKDDETLQQGESIGVSLFKAIEESKIAIIIFSKNYVNSSWCLDELAYIMKCKVGRGLIVMPIFYDVEPSEVRKQNGDFGKGFAKQEVENINKAELWRKALFDASNIAGWEIKNITNGHESQAIKRIVDRVFSRLLPSKSNFDEGLIGMWTRLRDLESWLDIGSGDVRMVGIWGVGGSGKTTLATSIYMKISHHFEGHCIVGSVREQSIKYDLKKLQEDVLSAIFKIEMKVESVQEGKLKIKSMLCRRKVLVLLDDVNKLGQLEALIGSHDWFGCGSRIIITTRNEHLLRTHKVNHVFPVKLLSRDEATQLLKKHAYNEEHPVEDYEKLSVRVVSYADGLPLALKVLGSFLYDKDKKGWMSTLARLKDIPEREIVEILKISYDGLEDVEKHLFLDIACFWRRKSKDNAMEIFESCNFFPEIGIEVLRKKALVSIVDGKFDMHDLVQDMAHYIVRGKHPYNPEMHSRVWKDEEINDMCLRNAQMENHYTEAIEYDGYHCVHKIVSNMTNLRYLRVSTKGHDRDHDHSLSSLCFLKKKKPMYDEGPSFHSNELRYIDWKGYPISPFPKSFNPIRLVVLKLSRSMQKELWVDRKHLPHLKVLVLEEMKKLRNTPDFDGLPHLQKLTLVNCDELKEIHQSLGSLKSLEYIRISHCRKLRMFPRRKIEMKNLKTLHVSACLRDGGILSGVVELSNLEELNLSCNTFSKLDFSLSRLTRLKLLNLSDCKKLRKLPEFPSSLAILKADNCDLLTTLGDCYQNCKWLGQVSLMGGGKITDGGRLLESMLKGNVIEHHSLLLLVQGHEIAKRFESCLQVFDQNTCTCELVPLNWQEFSGFVMCAVLPSGRHWNSYVEITSNDGPAGHLDFKKTKSTDKCTLVWYVSFESLTQTEWWDYQIHRSTTIQLKIEYKGCTGIGAKLVPRRSGSSLRESSTDSDYSPQINIERDTRSNIVISFKLL
ncbi:hypothetical protein SSX86_010734 [Deinandra increscens subsp. villosa]|uniref:ADP-ribosyl cyclase/cyclic ADP-ribose hydrolase n=1 Tax=Deinandra increscens subsp. villosa TaxID=3103831 RepID=A0AAP0H0K3_9ASTR